MKLVDANVLLYAVNTQSAHHEASRQWLDTSLSGGDRVGLAWLPLIAFTRLSTSPRAFSAPLTPEQAMRRVQEWLAAPSAVIAQPTERHGIILADLMAKAGTGGNLTNDAHMAALALEHRATVVTYDTDFTRFPITSARPDQLLP
ncbi:type II toxin-antitoxin system VapC family toxin [Ornithinimicrobium sp. Y1847]|uniref:type II toxin-antitoxin system VapC family toxin n=1 Tax=unclassified Ornithinimicrobium TaxID=2615080 RepID=UPI003B680952